MGNRKIQPPGRTDLPPVFCGQQEQAGIGVRHVTVAVLLGANFLLALVILLGNFPTREARGEMRKELQQTPCSPIEVAAVLIFSSLIPAVVLCTLFLGIPRSVAPISAMPIALVLAIAFVLSCRELQVAIRYQAGTGDGESSLLLALSLGALFATISAAIGLMVGLSLAMAPNK